MYNHVSVLQSIYIITRREILIRNLTGVQLGLNVHGRM